MTSSSALLWAALLLRTGWLLPDWVQKWRRVWRDEPVDERRRAKSPRRR